MISCQKKKLKYSVCFATSVREEGISWFGDGRVRGLRIGEPVCGFLFSDVEYFDQLEFGGGGLAEGDCPHPGSRGVL